MTRLFPGATKTFTVSRNGAVLQPNGNKLPGQIIIATGLSVALAPNAGVVNQEDGTSQFVGAYKAGTFIDAPIFIKDVLADETETELDGTPVKYEVQDKTLGAFSMDLRLRRNYI
jgi:hypothetical protein